MNDKEDGECKVCNGTGRAEWNGSAKMATQDDLRSCPDCTDEHHGVTIMQSPDDMEEAFEKWANDHRLILKRSATTEFKYWVHAVEDSWRTWQAAYKAGKGSQNER